MKKKLLLCTAIFKQNLPFLEAFFESVSRQDGELFDFLIINEDIDVLPYKKWINKSTVLNSTGTPLENRLQMIRFAKEKGYKYIAWQDSDDICSEQRITTILEEIKDFDVIVHDMRLIDNMGQIISGSFIGDRFCNKDINFKDIKYKNFIGFGNTAIRVDCLNPDMYIPEIIKAVDWWIACSLALEGKKMKYIDNKLSDYRQYDSNLANLKVASMNQLLRQLEIINAHYIGLVHSSLVNDVMLKSELRMHEQKIKGIKDKIHEGELLGIMALFNERLSNQYVWWEQINDAIMEVKF